MNVEDFKNGQILLIDKPLNWTSFQVVNKLRWVIRKKYNIKKATEKGIASSLFVKIYINKSERLTIDDVITKLEKISTGV